MSELITPQLVNLDVSYGGTAKEVITSLVAQVVATGRASDGTALFEDAWAREEKVGTGVKGGIAIPHCRSAAVTEPTLVFARLAEKADFGAKDGPADLVFLIAAPAGADQEHVKLLSTLARSLMKKDFTAALRAASSETEVTELVAKVLEPVTNSPEVKTAPQTEIGTDKPVLLAVTACATGIAHTYMAADALSAAAEEMGVELHVETQGSAGSTPIPEATIARASAVIFATDVDVRNPARFAGLALVRDRVKAGIDKPEALIAQAIAVGKNPNAERVSANSTTESRDEKASSSGFSGSEIKRWLLTGVSYMIPFVAAGGLLIALGFLLGGYDIDGITDKVLTENSLWDLPAGGLATYLGAVAFKIGGLAMGFLVPALAGYIAFAIADRPGLAPGFVVGAVAGFTGAGFIGGLIGGILAGLVARWLANFNVPRWLAGLMPVVIIPLIASIVSSGLMIMVLGRPIASLTDSLYDWLGGMTGTSAIILGAILGAMMAFDLGGPVNKVAYSFAVAGLSVATLENQVPWQIMATVMAAGMVPPLGMALASTVIDRKLFTPAERENGKTAWLLGASFISEGAIPFAAADIFRVIPASVLGSVVTGMMVMANGVTLKAPHGGIFVFFAIDGIWWFIAALVAGTLLTGFSVVALKRLTKKQPGGSSSAKTPTATVAN